MLIEVGPGDNIVPSASLELLPPVPDGYERRIVITPKKRGLFTILNLFEANAPEQLAHDYAARHDIPPGLALQIGAGLRASEIRRLSAVAVEFDSGSVEEQLARLSGLRYPPSLIVSSGDMRPETLAVMGLRP